MEASTFCGRDIGNKAWKQVPSVEGILELRGGSQRRVLGVSEQNDTPIFQGRSSERLACFGNYFWVIRIRKVSSLTLF